MIKETYPYAEDSSELFARIRHLPWAVYLDSCQPHGLQGRYDIISACPHTTLLTYGDITHIDDGHNTRDSNDDPFTLVQQALGDNIDKHSHLPFIGGAIGYFSYDLGRRLEKLPQKAETDVSTPEMAVGIYDWAIIIDHQQCTTQLVAANRHPATEKILQKIRQCLASPIKTPDAFSLKSSMQSNMSYEEYATRFNDIMRYIRQGDCYQVNLTQRFSAPYRGSPWHAYQQLRRENPAPYSAYLSLPDADILSLSPERFLQLEQNTVKSKPMKGTRPRGETTEADHQLAIDLQHSEKDRAENVMIVDLIRNDISKVCAPNTVKVPELFKIEAFPAVHQLVSTVSGQLADGKSATDLLRACFPGGSITGAPKIRAMEIIEELEPQRRNIYCGSIAYISHHQHMDSNIAIRTLLCHQQHIYCSAGGALVADSELNSEYQETLDKIAVIKRVLENLKRITT